ncbi:hypothetical protein NE237_013412 [Protea cynaroides]|uniref:Uncharacterized protein n=1 Tax=Protea cynaroides TaxID=273540 RepID=A0A9Q0JXU8_9MAGN|nr:hypothetical protein NE237_013412 [Protea cynaroides]
MDDPFTEIERECLILPSQEEPLRRSRFYDGTRVDPECSSGIVDPERSSGDESILEGGFLVDSTGIEMYSLSDKPASQSDEFLMAQENIPMSSQEQALNLTGTGADDHHKELKARGNVSPDHIRTVGFLKKISEDC